MHIPVLIARPEMLGPVLRGTPSWVWLLLAALVWLGLSQLRDRTVSLARASLMPLVMTSLSIWGLASAFGNSPMYGYTMLMWMFAAAVAFAWVGTMRPPAGAEYDAANRTFFLPGSAVPLLLIAGIFATRYLVNVDVAIEPALARDGQYTLVVGALYGLFSGVFLGRAARLWRLAAEHGGFNFTLQRDPW